MIVRVLSARVRPGRASHFNALIREQQDILRAQPGLVYVKLARRLEADGSEDDDENEEIGEEDEENNPFSLNDDKEDNTNTLI